METGLQMVWRSLWDLIPWSHPLIPRQNRYQAVGVTGMIALFFLLMGLGIFRQRRFRLGIFTPFFIGICLSLSAANVHAHENGPGWFNIQGNQITPGQSRLYYQGLKKTRTLTAQSLSATAADDSDPEIVELARALQSDPKLIYEYVHNHIDYVPYYGSLKGATLTYLDGAGNDFDQASLMIALLRAGGYEAQYVYGTLSIPASGAGNQKDMQHWLGVSDNNVISNILNKGGISYTSGSEYEVDRVWVRATIDGAVYLFDPAFKIYETLSGIDLAQAMGYDQTDVIAAAGGTVNANENSVVNLNSDALGAQLTSYSTALYNAIQSSYPNASMEEIIGGRTIVPEYLETLPESLEFTIVSQNALWDEIPPEYTHTVNIAYADINKTIYIPALGGKRLSVTYNDAAQIQTATSARTEAFRSVQTASSTPEIPDVESHPISPDYFLNKADSPVQVHSTNEPVDFFIWSPDDPPYCRGIISYTNNQTIPGAVLHITFSLENNSSGAFSLSSGGGHHDLSIGESVTVNGCFSPSGQTSGTKTARLKIVYYYSAPGYLDSQTSTVYRNLTGTVARTPEIALSSSGFGQAYLNTPKDAVFRIYNNGSLNLAINGFSFRGDDPDQFVPPGNTGVIRPGGYMDVNVTYLAGDIGTHSAIMDIAVTYDGVNRTSSWRMGAETISPRAAQLWLDDELIASEENPGSGDNPDTMFLTIEHPYADETLRNWSRQKVEYPMIRGENYYAIVYDFGGSRDGRLLEKRERQLKDYRLSEGGDGSRQVVTETLNVMGMTWMRDTTLNAVLLNELSNVVSIHHHRFGVVAQETGYYIDIKAQKSGSVSRENDSQALEARFKAGNFLASALEHGVLEQLQVDRPAVSTVKLLHLTNHDHDPVFLVTSANFAAIKNQLDYSQGKIDDFQTDVNNGYTLILPANGQIALDAGTGHGWAGEGYIRYGNTNGSMSCAMIISGDHYGGYTVVDAPVETRVVDQRITPNIQPDADQADVLAGEPVDMTTGYWVFNQTDLALSGGRSGLAFNRRYFSGNHQIKSKLGYGWSHNYDLYARVQSNTPYGLGQRLPTDSTALMAASVIMLDLMTGDADIRDWMTAALIGQWGMDTLTDNAVNLHLASDILTYIRQPNGSYSLPPGTNGELILDNGQYRLENRFDRIIRFDTANRISTITDADGYKITFTYANGNVDTVADDFGHSLSFAYTGNTEDGKLTTVTDSEGRHIRFDYTGDDLTAYTDPEGKQWHYGYDAGHRVLTLENPNGITTITNVYDTLGRVMTQTAPRQNSTAIYNYYFSGYRNVEEENSRGSQTVYHYDRKKRLVATENALGNRTSRIYDGRNHVVQTTDPRGNTTLYTYDGNNNLVRVKNALGNETVNQYDGLFRLKKVTDPLENEIDYDYDSRHHLLSTRVYPTPGQTVVSSAVYDDATGFKKNQTDGRDITTAFEYDNYGNPDTAKTAQHPPIDYNYNGIGLLTALTDQKNQTTTFTYNNRGQLKTRTGPNENPVTITYFDDGKIEIITDRNQDAVTYAYTDSGKIENINFPDGPATEFDYDTLDNLIRMQDRAGTTTFEYDAINRLTARTDANGFTVAYSYDDAGNLETLTYPGHKTITYSYDKLNRLKTVTDWLDRTAEYHYDDAGRPDYLTQFNGTIVDYSYDNANRLTGLANLTATGGTTIAAYAFTLDGNGNRTGVTRDTPLGLDGLADATSGYTIGSNNRLTAAGTDTFTYDNEGQLATAYGNTLTFDYEHRLTGVSGTNEFQYTYDGAGNRISAVRSGTETRYIYDASGNLLAEADSEGVTRYYIYGAGLLAMADTSGTMYCYHFDATGHTVAMTNSSKAIVNAYAYTPFGTIANQQEVVTQPFKFVGQFGVMTEDNGWYCMRARYYDPETHRFISQDPMGFDGGDVNLYAYALNNPVLFSDPLGLWTFSLGVNINAALGIGGGGGTALNFGYSENDGFSFSITGTAQGGAIAGAGAFAGGVVTITNADNVNQLNGTSYEAGRSGIGPVFVEGVKGTGYEGISIGGGAGIGFTANSLTASTTSAIYQYQNGTHSLGNTGTDSIWSSGK